MSYQPEAGMLPSVTKKMILELIRAYAEASGDLNPLHLNPGFASQKRFGGIVAHGLLPLAYTNEMLTLEFGPRWLRGGKLRLWFKAPAYAGDELSTFGSACNGIPDKGRWLVTCRGV